MFDTRNAKVVVVVVVVMVVVVAAHRSMASKTDIMSVSFLPYSCRWPPAHDNP